MSKKIEDDILYQQLVRAGGKAGSSGTPTGTVDINVTANGTTEHDVAGYATARVTTAVPEPAGETTIKITQNGTTSHNIKDYATASVQVNVPQPEGVTTITSNGDHDVTAFKTAHVAIPVPAEPAGDKAITIAQNGTTTHDVKAVASATITVQVPEKPDPTGTLGVAENGLHDCAQYAQVNVNVPTGGGSGGGDPWAGLNEVANKTVTELVSDTLTALPVFKDDYGHTVPGIFYRQPKLQKIKLTAFIGNSRDENTFNGCDALTDVDMPACMEACKQMFAYCGKLVNVHMPKIWTIPNEAFSGCISLEKLKFESVASIGVSCFNNCNKLKVIDIAGRSDNYSGAIASDMSRLSLTSFVLRNEDPAHLNGLQSNAKFPAGCNIYVPDALVDAYKAATNWSNYAAQIKPLSTYVEV